jgi:hypothetical protein
MSEKLEKDFPESDLLQFAYFLKEAVKRHDKNLEVIEADNKLRDEKINKIREDMITLSGNMRNIADSIAAIGDKGKFGWSVVEKALAFVGFLIIAGLMIWQILVT